MKLHQVILESAIWAMHSRATTVTHWQSTARPQQADQQKGNVKLHDVRQCLKTWGTSLKDHMMETFYQERKLSGNQAPQTGLTVSLALLCLSVLLLPHLVHIPFKFSQCELSALSPPPTCPDGVWSVWQAFLMASGSDTYNTRQLSVLLGVSHVC